MALLEQEGGLPKGYTAARAAPRGARGGAHRGMLPTRGMIPSHRGLLPTTSLPRAAPPANTPATAAAAAHLPIRGKFSPAGSCNMNVTLGTLVQGI